MKTYLQMTAVCALLSLSGALHAEVWRPLGHTESAQENLAALPGALPDTGRLLEMSVGEMQAIFDSTVLEGTGPVALTALPVPMPGGGLEMFEIEESPVMEPGLAGWLASEGLPIRTFLGRSVDNPATTARFDWGGPEGFHALVVGPQRRYFVDPMPEAGKNIFVSHDEPLSAIASPVQCEVDGAPEPAEIQRKKSSVIAKSASTGGSLRTYRLAFAATGDYTDNLSGGSKATAQANLVTLVNRINVTYERELSVRFVLVDDNQNIVFDDAFSDPYTESSASTMLGENQSTIDLIIGDADYDIGHVVYNGGSGIATVGIPCSASFKARGVSGVFSATGDIAVVDMIAHEIGHQFGATHTFNSPLSSCASNRTANSAYEPGGGTTIMSYSGSCSDDNIQTYSDDYFHGQSLDQMLAEVESNGSCPMSTASVNPNAPVVTADSGFTIPVGTPFELAVTSATDGDGDSLTFSWEQFDLGGAATIAAGDLGSGPLIRSSAPIADSTRAVTGARFGETLPTTDRPLNFRVTARDNRAGGGRVGEATVALTATTAAGPFMLIFPNGGESLVPGSTQSVTWNVAGTDSGGVNTSLVDILLSTDGGETFGTVLASGVANDGFQNVVLPFITSASTRIRIKAVGNIFFDESDSDFGINAYSQCVSPGAEIAATEDLVINGQSELIADMDVSLVLSYPTMGFVRATIEHVDTGTSALLFSRPGVASDFDSAYGCSIANMDATLDDEGVGAAEDACNTSAPALSGQLIPTESLSVFDGESPNGTWRLSVTEPYYYYTSGSQTLDSFCIKATFAAVNACYSGPLTVGPVTYAANENVRSDDSIMTSGDVIVNSGAIVAFEAPNGIGLSAGFSVQMGAEFSATMTDGACTS